MEYSAFASDLGWPVGYHAQTFSFKNTYFSLEHEEVRDGDVKYWSYCEMRADMDQRLYKVPNGAIVTVFND